VFLGTHSPKLDDKGRLFLPAKFREELAPGVVITKGHERCLFVFKAEDFAAQAEVLSKGPLTGTALRDSERIFYASASDDIPDSQGRIRVPAPLRTYAGLTKECTVIGMNTRLEIWDAAAWAAYEAAKDVSYADPEPEVPAHTT
jgi:MraZ protein